MQMHYADEDPSTLSITFAILQHHAYPTSLSQTSPTPLVSPLSLLQPTIQNIHDIMTRPRAPIPARLLHDVGKLDFVLYT
jgi:hypothetical protein